MQRLGRLLPAYFSASNSDESPRHRTVQQRARNWLFLRLRSRRHRAVLLLLLLVFGSALAAFIALQLLPQHSGMGASSWTRRGRVAYVTLLCEQRRPDPVLVLAAGLRSLGSAAPIIVLALAPLDSATHRQLLHPDSGIAEVRERTARLADSQRPDRCSAELIVELWNLTEYSRVVFLDAERVLPLRSLDALFSAPQLSAAQNAAGELDAAVMVLEPSASVYSELVDGNFSSPSMHDGVRGFLHGYFTDAATLQPLPLEYRLSISFSRHSWWPARSSAHLALFTEGIKPWSLFASATPDWEREVDGQLFYLWTQRRQRLYAALFNVSAHELSVSNSSSPPLAALNLSLPGVAHVRHLDAASAACSSPWPDAASLRDDRYSVVLGTFGHSERVAVLLRLIPHYLSSQHVDRVFLTWHNPNLSVPAAISALLSSQQLHLLPMKVDSLNNRFLPPFDGLRTRAVYIADDDVRIPVADIDRAFMLWRTNPQQLVGFFPRSHIAVACPDLSPPTYQYTLHTLGRVPGYSMVLTKGFFAASVFLYYYSCLLPAKAHAYVNMVMNCEDILFNMMVSGMTGLPPLALATEVDEFGGFTGLSQGKDHVELRGDCLTDFTRMLGGEMPLRYSSAFVHAYPEKDAVHYVKKALSQWPEK